MDSPDRTKVLLQRWHGGEREALDLLLAENHEWLLGVVRERMGRNLRRKAESLDLVQDAMAEILAYVPESAVPDRQRFRALLARIAQNVLSDQHQFFRAAKRDRDREVAGDAVLDELHRSQTSPEGAAVRSEERGWVRLALEYLDREDRQVVVLRQWEGLEFAEIGRRVGLAENAARMRFTRAVGKLAKRVKALRDGDWD